MIGHDLRTAPEDLLNKLESFQSYAPTLLLSECVFMYMPVQETNDLLKTFTTVCSDVTLCAYEPALGNNTTFGRMMEQNLHRAKVAMPQSCLLQLRTISQHLQRLVHDAGFHTSVGCDMWSAYQSIVTPQQRQIANRCEFLDEMEEWMMIMRHYTFVTARVQGVQFDMTQQLGYNERMSERLNAE